MDTDLRSSIDALLLQGWSPRRIIRHLRRDGHALEVIRAALATSDVDYQPRTDRSRVWILGGVLIVVGAASIGLHFGNEYPLDVGSCLRWGLCAAAWYGFAVGMALSAGGWGRCKMMRDRYQRLWSNATKR